MSKTLTSPSPTRVVQVPMLDFARQYAPIREEIVAAVTRVCDSQRYVLSDEVTAFEQEFAQYCGVAHAVGCASGTDALWLSLIAAGVLPGDSVVTTPFTFFATASTIARAGARPVLVDVDPDTLNIDPAKVAILLERSQPAKLKAMMPVHLYGQCADADALDRIARDNKIMVIEDAAQAVGATWRGRRAGSLGAIAGFSFYPTKNLSAFGDAGIVTTADAELDARLRRLRNHGSRVRYYHEELGWNSRLDSIQAAILRVKLKYIEQWNAARRNHAAAYDRMFRETGLADGEGSPVRVLKNRPEAANVYHQYVIRVHRRDELRAFLAEHKVGSEVYYPVPLHRQQCFGYLGYAEGDLPESERAAREVLALPMFAELTEDEQRYVVGTIAKFFS